MADIDNGNITDAVTEQVDCGDFSTITIPFDIELIKYIGSDISITTPNKVEDEESGD